MERSDAHAKPAPRPDAVFDGWSIALGLFGLGNLSNGLWMLADPVHWYFTLPAGVPDFGPLNEHFVRDIGCIYTLLGAFLVAAAFRPRWRLAACALATGFLALHALVHVWDTARGLVGPAHWAIDLPGVYLPALLVGAITIWIARSQP